MLENEKENVTMYLKNLVCYVINSYPVVSLIITTNLSELEYYKQTFLLLNFKQRQDKNRDILNQNLNFCYARYFVTHSKHSTL